MLRTLVLVLAVGGPFAHAQEQVAKSRIVSLGIFKNGTAAVKRQVEIKDAGVYRLDAEIQPIHGTFWIDSNRSVEVHVKEREVDVPVSPSEMYVQLKEQLAGKKVTITLRDAKRPPIQGTMLRVEGPRKGDYAPDSIHLDPMLVLKTDKGRLFVSYEDISTLECEEIPDTVKRRRSAVFLTVAKGEQPPVVHISYLMDGMSWAPSYRVDISNPKKLALEMATALRNEQADFQDAEVHLISGFPNIEFGHVTSLLSPKMTWGEFAAQMGQSGTRGNQGLNQLRNLANPFSANGLVVQDGPIDLGAAPAGEGVDLHFQPIGKRSLKKGETVSFSLASGESAYERMVEWTVGKATNRDHDNPEGDEIWDVLHFKNPLSFPLTMAPALVIEKDRFNGQRALHWTNTGEETTLRVTKSLSVRTFAREFEDETKIKDEKPILIDGHSHRHVHMVGELHLSNHRKETIKLRVRQRIKGKLDKADGDPVTRLRESTISDTNRTFDVIWTFTMPPGGSRKLEYRYRFLVRRAEPG